MSDIHAFFDLVGREVVSQLGKVDPNGSETRHWVVIKDSIGAATSPVEDSKPHEVLQSLMAQGVDGAAYVTYVPGQSERILAYAVVTDPSNSDVRQSPVVREAGSIALGPWECAA